MDEDDRAAESPAVHIEADPGRVWTALVFWSLRMPVVLLGLVVVVLVERPADTTGMLLGMVVLVVLVTLILAVPTAVVWWIRPGRVTYVVADGELRVLRGRRVVQSHPCADITHLELSGQLDWHALFFRNWFTTGLETMPQLAVDRKNWPSPRLLVGPRSQPAIFLWGPGRTGAAERVLRTAVTAHGAVLRDTP